MKTKPVRFGRVVVLSILFFTCIFSLMLEERREPSTWNDVHIWSGMLMVIGAAVHLRTNWNWVRAAFSRPARELKHSLRRLRRTDFWLFISGSLCTSAGLAWLVPGANLEIVGLSANIHRLIGIIMILMLVIHLVQHWNWFVKTARLMRESQPPKTADRFGEAKA